MGRIKNKGSKIILSALISAGILFLLLSVAAFMTVKGIITEDMMTPIICISVFAAGFAASLIQSKNYQQARLIRGFMAGLILFGVPFLIGKTTSIETIETGKASAILAFSLIGSITGTVISNKKRGYHRR